MWTFRLAVFSSCFLLSSHVIGQLSITQDMSVIPPRVKDAFTNNSVHVPAGTQAMNVGVKVVLEAIGTGPLTEIQWSFPCNAIRDYRITSNKQTGKGFQVECMEQALTASCLKHDKLAFFFTQTGTCTVNLTAKVGGVLETASMTFVVERDPKAETYFVTGPGGWTDEVGVDDRDNILGEHLYYHKILQAVVPAAEFLRFHRGLIHKFNCWRETFGYPCVQPWATGPGYVPMGPDVDHSGSNCTTGSCTPPNGSGTGIVSTPRDSTSHSAIERLPLRFLINGGATTPYSSTCHGTGSCDFNMIGSAGETKLADFADENVLSTSLIRYHNRMHSLLCSSGDMLYVTRTPADPMFWRFHYTLTKLHELWMLLKIEGTTVTVEATSSAGASVNFPDPSMGFASTDFLDSTVGCAGSFPFISAPASGSLFPMGSTTVTVTGQDVVLLDSGAPSSVTSLGSTRTFTFTVNVVPSASPSDGFVEDTPYDYSGAPDLGNEPDANMASLSMWKSRAIWVRNSDVPVGSTTFADHENPEFGQPNWVYVRLQNSGPNVTAHEPVTGKIQLFHADASAGLSWPTDFTHFATIPDVSLAAGASGTFKREFNPPCVGHFCFVAIWKSSQDHLTNPLSSNISQNTRMNNNIAWRNVNIADVVLDTKLFLKSIVRNPFDRISQVCLWLDPGDLLGVSEVFLDIGPELTNRWQKSATRGQNLELGRDQNGRPLFFIFGRTQIFLPLLPREAHAVTIQVLGRQATTETFHLDLRETIDGEEIGGVAYAVRVGVPKAPNEFQVTEVGLDNVELTWDSRNLGRYVLECRRQEGDFVRVAEFSRQENRFVHQGLDEGTLYCYRIRCINDIGPSPHTIPICVTTDVNLPAPENFHVDETGLDSVTLRWSDVAQGETHYVIERSHSAPLFGVHHPIVFEPFAELPADSESYIDTDVGPDEYYSYQLRAVNDIGSSRLVETYAHTENPLALGLRVVVLDPEVEAPGHGDGHGDEREDLPWQIPTPVGSDNIVVELGVVIDSQLPHESPGVNGWSFGILTPDCFEVFSATTEGTVADTDSNPQGLRRNGFESTQIVDPGRNGGRSGVVTAVVLSFTADVALPPESESLVLRIGGLMDASSLENIGDVSEICEVRPVEADETSLRGAGEPVELLATVGGESRTLSSQGALLQLVAVSSEPEFIRGDFDTSGVLQLTDAVGLLGFLFLGGPATSCDDAADSNDSGVVDLTDAVKVLNFLFIGAPPPPAPYPLCGIDPTPDPLGCVSYPLCP